MIPAIAVSTGADRGDTMPSSVTKWGVWFRFPQALTPGLTHRYHIAARHRREY